MTNQQGAPEALTVVAPTKAQIIEGLRAVQSSIGWRRPHILDQPECTHWDYIDAACAALVEAQQPAPSAAVVGETVKFGHCAKCGRSNTLDHPDCKSPTPQADSQPAPVQSEREAFERWQTDVLGRSLDELTQGSERPDEYDDVDVHNEWTAWRARAARAPADSVTAPAGGLGWKLVPMEITDAMRNAAAQAGMEALDLRDAGASNVGLVPKMYEAMLAAAPTPPAQAADSVLEDAARLAKITKAIRDYHFALDCREHGGVAMARAWNAICDVLNMDWVQGAESAARKQGADHD